MKAVTDHRTDQAIDPSRPAIDDTVFLVGLGRGARIVMAVVILALAWWLAAFITAGYLTWLLLLMALLLIYTGFSGFALTLVGAVLVLRIQAQYGQPVDWAWESILALVVIVFLSVSFRYCELLKYAIAYEVDDRIREASSFPSRRAWQSLVGPRWWSGALSVLVSAGLLTAFPEQRAMVYDYGLREAPGRLIFFLLGLFFAWWICRALIGIAARFRLTPEVADIASRSMYNTELWSEMAGVERRRAKPHGRDN